MFYDYSNVLVAKYVATEHGFYNMLTNGAIIKVPRKADLEKYLEVYGDSSNEPPKVVMDDDDFDCEDEEEDDEFIQLERGTPDTDLYRGGTDFW